MLKTSPTHPRTFKQNGKISANFCNGKPFTMDYFVAIFRLEMKVKEVESRLELEQATRSRLEVQFNRYKDALDKAQQETSQTKAKEQNAQDSLKKVQKSLRYRFQNCLFAESQFHWVFCSTGNYVKNITCCRIAKMITLSNVKIWNKNARTPNRK